MKIYTKDMMGREIGVGSEVITTEPHNGRRLVKGIVVRISELGIWVQFKDTRWGQNRVSMRRFNQVVA